MSFNVPYLVGNKFKRDHIMWPTILRSQIDTVFPGLTDDQKDAIWPVDITLAQMLALCWRVRKWELSGSATVSKTISFPNPPDADIVKTASGTATVDATEIVTLLNGVEAIRERDLVGKVFAENETHYKNLVNDGFSSVPGNAPVSDWSTTSEEFGDWTGFIDIALQILGGYQLFDPAAEKFSPAWDGLGQLIPSISGQNQLILSAAFTRNPETVLSGPTPLNLKVPISLTVIPGIESSFDVPMELIWRFQSEVPGGTVEGTGSGAFTLQATEFWPYENTLGQAIFDTASGEPTGSDPFA